MLEEYLGNESCRRKETHKFAMTVKKVQKFVSDHGRLPKQTSTSKTERKLALWINDIKKRSTGSRLPSLTSEEILRLDQIPGWTWNRWERSPNTGTRKGKAGWEAQIKVSGTIHYGPPRSTRPQARRDYLELRAAADSSEEAFEIALKKMKATARSDGTA